MAGATDLHSGEPCLAIRASGLIKKKGRGGGMAKSGIEAKGKFSFPQHQTLASRRKVWKRN